MTIAYPAETFAPFPAIAPAVHDPRREIRAGAALVAFFVVGVVGWATVARLDAAVYSQGVVRVSGDRQVVQSPTGGVVSALNVRDGDRVRAGQVLVELATTEVLAQERSLASRVIGLRAEIARIRAERLGLRLIEPPADFIAIDGDLRREADRALAMEQAELDAQRSLERSERAVMRQRIAQVGHQIEGYRRRQTSSLRQRSLNDDELGAYETLLKKGFATKQRVLALQRSAAAIDGDTGTNLAEIARLRTSAGETRLQLIQLRFQRQQQNAERLRTAETELQTLLPQWRAARDQLDRTSLRAPVGGTVTGLALHTIGGVAPAGATLMEVVPADRAFEVEAQVAPADAADLHAGQVAEVRLSGLQGRTAPVLEGTITRVSADTIVDQRSGQAFYLARVRVPARAFEDAGREAALRGAVRPGAPVEVLVPLEARTALRYWLGPLVGRLSHTMIER